MTDLRERLAAARLYLCTDGRRAEGDLAEFLDAVLAGGVDIVQLREKGLEAREELALLEVFADACRKHGRLLADVPTERFFNGPLAPEATLFLKGELPWD